MNVPTKKERLIGLSVTVILLVFAVWLVSPFFHIDRSSFAHGKEYGYRLAIGLLILLSFVGKWAFDALSPQGLAIKVSNLKAAALILMSLIIMGFIVFVVAQATVLYLRTAAAEEQRQTDIY